MGACSFSIRIPVSPGHPVRSQQCDLRSCEYIPCDAIALPSNPLLSRLPICLIIFFRDSSSNIFNDRWLVSYFRAYDALVAFESFVHHGFRPSYT